MPRHPITRYLAVLLAALALAGCAAERAYREGNDLAAQDRTAAALTKYREAIAADPGNPHYKVAFLRTRDNATVRLLEQADRDLAGGRTDPAVEGYRQVLAIDPANQRAAAGLRQVEASRRHAAMLGTAAEALGRGDTDAARQKLEAILSEQPANDAARQMLQQVGARERASTPEGALAAAFRKPISLEFRDAPLRQVFEVISRHSGLNFIFDKDVRPDLRTSIFLKNSTVEAAVHFLLLTNQLERQVMDGNTVLIYPNLQAKVKEYQDTVVKTFHLAHADAKNVANTLKTILKTRDIVIDEKLNLVILRDSPDAVRLASRIVALQDVAEPEVMLDVEVIEIQRSRATELGVSWPSSLSLAPLAAADGKPISISQLRALDSDSIGVGGAVASVNARKTDGSTNTLANPRIRVRNKEKASVNIGDKLPTFTTTVSSGVGGFASESVSFVDVGLKLNVEPSIHLDNEVAIRISLEVSNVIDTVTSKSGSIAYRIGTRNASTLLQLKDGENQVLAGLIRNEDRSSGKKVPLLGDIPLLGRLFGTTTDGKDQTEIVLSITPHLVRSVQRPSAEASEFSAGTEASMRRRPDPTPRVPAPGPATAPVRAVPAQPAAAVPAGAMPPAVQNAPAPLAPPVQQPGVQVNVVPAQPAPAPAPAQPATPPVEVPQAQPGNGQ